MKVREYNKRILIFSLAFILGVFAVIKNVQFQENKTAEPQTELIQRSEPNPDPELTALKEKLRKLYKPCNAPFDGNDDSTSFYEIQNSYEMEYLHTQIDLIKGKKEGFSQKRIKATESRLEQIESAIRKFKNEIKRFESDVIAGKIDPKIYNRSLIYLAYCVQK